MFIKNNLSWINVEIACRCLRLNRSSYYNWINNEPNRLERLEIRNKLLKLIVVEFEKSKRRYGSNKITKILKKTGIVCNRKTVAKLMQENNIKSIVNKKFKATTNSKHKLPIFDNILDRQFIVPHPNYAWVGDITYIWTNEGWLYLATVIDLYSNKVIGFAMSDRINTQLVVDALLKALKTRGYPTGVIVHSDRGSQYASNAYKAILKQYKLLGSMSRKGNCWDNAVAENFFALIKKEYINQNSFVTRNQAKLGIFDYIEGWYNTHRIHSKTNYLTPNEFEKFYFNLPVDKIKTININLKMEVKTTQL
jgi:putative transposase